MFKLLFMSSYMCMKKKKNTCWGNGICMQS